MISSGCGTGCYIKGADFIKQGEEIHAKVTSDPDINASGDLEKRVAPSSAPT